MASSALNPPSVKCNPVKMNSGMIEHADDVRHQLIAEERAFEAALGETLHGARRMTTVSRLRQVLGPFSASVGQARVVGGELGVLLGGGTGPPREAGGHRRGAPAIGSGRRRVHALLPVGGAIP